MNGVNLADQRRAAYTTHQRSRRNWMSLFRSLLDISIVNAHILFTPKRHARFVAGIDSGDIPPDLAGTHELGRDYTANKFRLEVAEHLPPLSARLKKPRIRTSYEKKATKICFSKCRRFVAGCWGRLRLPSHWLIKIIKR